MWVEIGKMCNSIIVGRGRCVDEKGREGGRTPCGGHRQGQGGKTIDSRSILAC